MPKNAKIYVAEGHALPEKPYSNPSINVCSAMGGTAVDYTQNGAYYGIIDKQAGTEYQDICTFGDGSALSAWSLVYAAYINAGVLDPRHQFIFNLIKSKHLPIKSPRLKY